MVEQKGPQILELEGLRGFRASGDKIGSYFPIIVGCGEHRQRGDSGFGGLTTKKVKRVCVSEDVDYVLGLANASIEK